MMPTTNTHREWAIGRRLLLWRPQRYETKRRLLPMMLVGMGYSATVHVEDFCRWFPSCAQWMERSSILLDVVRGIDGHCLCAIMESPIQAETLYTTWADYLRPMSEAFTSRSMQGSRFRTSYVERNHELKARHNSITKVMPYFVTLPAMRPTADELNRLDALMNGPYHQTFIHPNVMMYFRDKQDFVLARMLLAS